MRVRAFAKINLSLCVLGRRADGYHELRTIFQSIALHDTLTIRKTRGPLTLTCDDPACPADRSNLVWRAANAVWRAARRSGPPRGVSIHLAKRIPIQAGLGGGSSDAAAAVRALGRLWRVPDERQRAIARSLGADVPYFFEGGTVLGLGCGDLLFPLVDAPGAWAVVVVPRFGVSTKDAFAWHDRDARRRKRARRRSSNDLEAAVASRHPEIRRLIGALRASGATLAAMTGSGAAVFGLYPSRPAARRAADALESTGRRLTIVVTRTLDRGEYKRLAGR